MLKTHPSAAWAFSRESSWKKAPGGPQSWGRVVYSAGGRKELGVWGQALLLPLSAPRAGSEVAGLLGPREAQQGLAGSGSSALT